MVAVQRTRAESPTDVKTRTGAHLAAFPRNVHAARSTRQCACEQATRRRVAAKRSSEFSEGQGVAVGRDARIAHMPRRSFTEQLPRSSPRRERTFSGPTLVTNLLLGAFYGSEARTLPNVQDVLFAQFRIN